MVYIKQNEEETIVISRNNGSISRNFDLILINNLTNEAITYPNILSTASNNILYCFTINTLDLESGEYSYFIRDVISAKILDKGLASVVTDEPEIIEYENDKKTIVYNG